ncbi:MAG: ATP-binding protein [Anaerolineales bacterium]
MFDNHIFVVSSDADFAGLLGGKILEPKGYRVTIYQNRLEAESAFHLSPPDLIILGENLKGADTLELATQFGKQNPTIPVVMILHYKKEKDFALTALRAGVFDCLTPPIHPNDIFETIERGLTHRQDWRNWAQSQAQRDTIPLRKRIIELETLSQVGKSVTSHLDLDQVLTTVIKAAVDLTGAEEGSLLLLDEATGELYMRAALNFQDEFVRTFRLPMQDTLAGQAVRTGKPILLDKQTPEKIKTHYLVHSLIYIPLKIHDRVIGVLGADNRSSGMQFTELHITVMSTLADYAAIAIENANLYAQSEFERAKLETMLKRVGDGLIVIDYQGNLMLVNHSAQEIFGITEDNYVGKPITTLIDHEELIESLKSVDGTARRIEISTQSGRFFTAQITPVPEVGLAVTLQDITHFKELDQLKNEFVHTVSHDLRSPLTAILGYVELIARVGNVNDQQKEFIRRVQLSVHNITDLINALLDLGRIEAGFDQQKESVPIPVIISYAVEGLRHQVDKKKQSLVLDVSQNLPPVYGNPIRLRQMLNNLIDNASKYTPEGGQITIRATSEGEQIIIQVEDTGVGIPPADQPYVFNKLFRASNVLSEMPGAGLGLAIVRSIVENHRGRYWFESALGEGTTFTIVLPVAKG